MNEDTENIQQENAEEAGLDAEAEQLRNELVQLSADFENFRKEITQSLMGSERFARATVIRSLAPSLDSFDFALRESQGKVEPQFLSGFQKVYDQMVRAFSSFGVVKIPARGSYDPKYHEAIERVAGEAHMIVEEVGGGWKFRDDEQVIVPARVRVGKGNSD